MPRKALVWVFRSGGVSSTEPGVTLARRSGVCLLCLLVGRLGSNRNPHVPLDSLERRPQKPTRRSTPHAQRTQTPNTRTRPQTTPNTSTRTSRQAARSMAHRTNHLLQTETTGVRNYPCVTAKIGRTREDYDEKRRRWKKYLPTERSCNCCDRSG